MQSDLNKVKKLLDSNLRKQTQDGLFEVYKELGCLGVAKEIRAGRNVTGNAEYGIRMCLHEKVGPRVNPDTLEFHPMTNKAMEIEEKFVDRIDKVLENGGFEKMSPSLLSGLRRKDEAFEERIRKLRMNR